MIAGIAIGFLIIFVICIRAKKSWVVRRGQFPYREGWMTYNWRTKTILDTGLSKEEAEEACEELNKRNNLRKYK